MSKYEDYKTGAESVNELATVSVDTLVLDGTYAFTAGADVKQTGVVNVRVMSSANTVVQYMVDSTGHTETRTMVKSTGVWSNWGVQSYSYSVLLPSVTVEGNPGSVPQGPVLTGSAFTSTDSADTHTSTDWVLVDSTGTAVWSSVQDTVNLTTVTLPSGTLGASTAYLLSVTYNSGTGASSRPSVVNFSTGLFPHVFTGTLTTKASGPKYAGFNTAAPLNDGRVLIAGGYGTAMMNDTYIYDPALDTWTAVAIIPVVLIRLNSSTLLDGTVLLTGGTIDGTTGIVATYLYDPVTNVWTQKANLNNARVHHGQTTLPDGTVLVTCGIPYSTAAQSLTITTAEIYDPVTNVWTAKPAVTSPALAFHVQATLTDGTVFVSGSNAGTDTTAYTYDPVTNVYTLLPNVTTGYKYGDCVQLPSGQIFITERGKLYNYDLVTGQTLLPTTYTSSGGGTDIGLLPDGTVYIHDYGRMYIYS